MKHNSLFNFASLIFAFFLLFTCDWDNYQSEVKPIEEVSEKRPKNNELRRSNINGIAILYNQVQGLRNDIGLSGDETGLSWMDGMAYRDSSNLNI